MKAGEKVQFNSRKGRVEGVVIGTKWSGKGRKAARQLNQVMRLRGIDSSLPEGRMVAEVADVKNRTIWTVGDNSYKVLGKATPAEMKEGRSLKSYIKAHNKEVKHRQANKNFGKCSENELLTLQPGDIIEIKYRGSGWKKEVFNHFTKSGKIAYRSRATKKGVRYAWPNYVRRPQ